MRGIRPGVDIGGSQEEIQDFWSAHERPAGSESMQHVRETAQRGLSNPEVWTATSMAGLILLPGIVLRGKACYVSSTNMWAKRSSILGCWGEEQWVCLLWLLWGSRMDERVRQEPQQRGFGLCSVRQKRSGLQQATLRGRYLFLSSWFYQYEVLYAICIPWNVSGLIRGRILYKRVPSVRLLFWVKVGIGYGALCERSVINFIGLDPLYHCGIAVPPSVLVQSAVAYGRTSKF